ncbi:hypothetical protein NDU88_005707 [Pleurodeles waltl]|uniref:Uncharacterized protein n=1 Tax=Pleurodeles waltl TaxID=8319 RepID=A0AAV7RKZ1_PLEWA|nr:hypothetical protein NDU88_005707 [Pleurodeles waltl]
MSHEELDWSPSSLSLTLSRGPVDSRTLPSNVQVCFLPVSTPFQPTGIASPSSIRERDQGQEQPLTAGRQFVSTLVFQFLRDEAKVLQFY